MDGLGRHADMGTDRDARLRNGADLRADVSAALQLHGICHSLLHEAAGRPQRLLRRHLVAHERHVHDHEGVAARPRHTSAIYDHFVQRDRDCVLIALHGHAKAVPDQDHIHTGAVHKAGSGVVIGGQHTDFPVVLFALKQGLHRTLHLKISFPMRSFGRPRHGAGEQKNTRFPCVRTVVRTEWERVAITS